MNDQLDAFIDQFYSKYSPNNIPQGERRAGLKQELSDDFDGIVNQMYSKYAPDNVPDSSRLANLRSEFYIKPTQPVTPQEQEQPLPESLTNDMSGMGLVGKVLNPLMSIIKNSITGGLASGSAASGAPEFTAEELGAPNIKDYRGLTKQQVLAKYPKDKSLLDAAYKIAGDSATPEQLQAAIEESYYAKNNEYRQALLDFSKERKADANKISKATGSIEDVDDIHNPIDALNYGVTGVSKAAGYLALAPLGPVPISLMERGEAFEEGLGDAKLGSDQDKKASSTSAISGAVNGALEYAGDLLVVGKLLPKGFAKSALTKLIFDSKLGSTAVKAIGEGSTELIQQFDTQIAAKMAQGMSATEAASSITWDDLKNDFYGGLVGGGGLGAVTSLPGKSKRQQARQELAQADIDAKAMLADQSTTDPDIDAEIDDNIVGESAKFVNSVAAASEKLEGENLEKQIADLNTKAEALLEENRILKQRQGLVDATEQLTTAPLAEEAPQAVRVQAAEQELADQDAAGVNTPQQNAIDRAEATEAYNDDINQDILNEIRTEKKPLTLEKSPIKTGKAPVKPGVTRTGGFKVAEVEQQKENAEEEKFIAKEDRYNSMIENALESKPGRKARSLESILKNAEKTGHEKIVSKVQKLIEANDKELEAKQERKEKKATKPKRTREEFRVETAKVKEEKAKIAAAKKINTVIEYNGKEDTIKNHKDRLLQNIADESVKVTKTEGNGKYEKAIAKYKEFRKEAGLKEETDAKIRAAVQAEHYQKEARRHEKGEKLDKKREAEKKVRLSKEEAAMKAEVKRQIAKDQGISEDDVADEDSLHFYSGKSEDYKELKKLEQRTLTYEEYKKLAPSSQHKIIDALNRVREKYRAKDKSNTNYIAYVVKKGEQAPRIGGYYYQNHKTGNSTIAAIIDENGNSTETSRGKNSILHEFMHEYTIPMFQRLYSNDKSFKEAITRTFKSAKKETYNQLKAIVSKYQKGQAMTDAEESLLNLAFVDMQDVSPQAHRLNSQDLDNYTAGEVAQKLVDAIYGLTDVHEFLAEALSDPHTQFFLSQVMTNEKITHGLNKGENKSLLYKWYEDLFKWVQNKFEYLLGASKSEFKSTLDVMMDVVSEYDSEFVSGDLPRTKAKLFASDIALKLGKEFSGTEDADNHKADMQIVRNISGTLEQRDTIKSEENVQKYIDRVNKRLDKKHQMGDGYARATWKRVKRLRKYRAATKKFQTHFVDYAKKRPEYKTSDAYQQMVDDFASVKVDDIDNTQLRTYEKALVRLSLNQNITKKGYDLVLKHGKSRAIIEDMGTVADKLRQSVPVSGTHLFSTASTTNNTLLTSLISKFNTKVSNTVLRNMFGGLMRAHTLTTNQGHTFASDLSQTAEKLNLTHSDLARIGMVGGIFSTVAEPGTSAWEEEVKANAEQALTSAQNKLKVKLNKKYRGQLTKEEVEKELTIAKEVKDKVDKGETFTDLLSKNQKVIYDKIRKFADDHVDDFERNAVAVWDNENFTRRFNYFPTKAQGRTDKNDKTADEIIRNSGDSLWEAMNEENKQNANSLYARKSMNQENRQKTKDYYYENNALSIAQPWSKNMLFDIYASPELRALNKVFADSKFKAAIGEDVREALIHQIKSISDAGNKYDRNSSKFSEAVGRAGSALYGVHLTTAGQFLTQMSSGVAGAAVLSASLNPVTAMRSMYKAIYASARSMREGTDEYAFVQNHALGIQHRDIQYERDLVPDDFRSGVKRKAQGLGNKIDKYNSFPLTAGDKFAARMVWFANYFDSGATMPKAEDDITPKQKEGILQSERKTGNMQNVSNMAMSATFFKYDNMYQRLLMSMFMGYKSFALNNFQSMLYSAPNLASSKEARQTFAASLAGITASTALTALAIKPFYSAIADSLADATDGDDDDDEEKRVGKAEEILTESVWQALIGGASPALLDGLLRNMFTTATRKIYTPEYEEYNKYLDSPIYSPKTPVDVFKNPYGAGTGELVGATVTAFDIYYQTALANDFLEAGEYEKAEEPLFEREQDIQTLTGTIVGLLPGIPHKGDIIKLLKGYAKEQKDRLRAAKAQGSGGTSGETPTEFVPDYSQDSPYTDEEYNNLQEQSVESNP